MKLLPFGSITRCPACGHDFSTGSLQVLYQIGRVRHAANGQWLEVAQVGDEPEPHLRKRCDRCGYRWLEEVCQPEAVV